MSGKLKGKVAVVTGAARGVGRAYALALAGEGTSVVVNDPGGGVDGSGGAGSPAQQVVKEIEAAGGEAIANHDSVADFAGAERIRERDLQLHSARRAADDPRERRHGGHDRGHHNRSVLPEDRGVSGRQGRDRRADDLRGDRAADTYDFNVKRRVNQDNLDALLRVGHETNERLLATQLEACQCAPDAQTLERVVLPSQEDGLPAPGLRFGDPRVMALLTCLCSFAHLIEGLTNRNLRPLVAGLIPGYSARQMTYDLRRLRRKGLIRRLPGSQRYELTSQGRRLAIFFSKTYTRIVCPALAELDPSLPETVARGTPLGRPWREFERALDQRIADAAIAARKDDPSVNVWTTKRS